MSKFLLLILVVISSCANLPSSQEETKSQGLLDTHRIQDTTKSENGWYYAKSTNGHFSIELPIPFNDFTLTTDSAKIYGIGSKSQEGIKFSIIEKTNQKQKDLDQIINDLKEPGKVISNIKKEKNNDFSSLYYKIKDSKAGCYTKILFKDNHSYDIIIEYPIEHEATVDELKDYFFSTFKLNN